MYLSLPTFFLATTILFLGTYIAYKYDTKVGCINIKSVVFRYCADRDTWMPPKTIACPITGAQTNDVAQNSIEHFD